MSTKLDFKISTGLKDIIGKELITDDQIAIFELVKNSYDAKAQNVHIIFQNLKNPGNQPSKILIIDDGDGMSYDDLNNKWLFVGYSEKKILEEGDKTRDYRDKTQKNKRFFAGAKGIGRFSSDRLGRKLILYTKKKKESIIHCLSMDWKKFEGIQEEEFHTIKVDYLPINKIPSEVPVPKNFMNGTIIEMSSLNSKWDREKLLRLRQYLQRLINPSQDPNNQEFKIELIADEFIDEDKHKESHEKVNGPVRNVVFEKLGIKTTHIKCNIDEGKIITELVDKGKFVFRIKEENKFQLLNDITIHVFFLNPEAKTAFSRIMGVQPVQYGSIFLYKNGFRIHPYGDEGDDWLGLEKRKGQGYARFLSNRELMGRIEIYGVQPEFKEVSSRSEGVVKTKALEQLHQFFIEKVLRRLEKYVVEGINWDTAKEEKQKTPEEIKRDSIEIIAKLAGQIKDPHKNIEFNPELLDILKKRQVENIPELIHNVESIKKYVKSPKAKTYIENQIKAVRRATKTLALQKNIAEEKLEEEKRETLFLKKALAPDKVTMQNLNHQIKISTDEIKSTLDDINEMIKDGKDGKEMIIHLDKISIENQKIKDISEIVSFAKFNLQVKKITKDLVMYITGYVGMVLSGYHERLKYEFINRHVTHVVKFAPLDISIIMDNLISNSRKADATLMKFKFVKKGSGIHVFVGDNGQGINKKSEEHIFTRGFSTTDGSGIGLYHIKTTLESMDGSIKFCGNNYNDLGKGACFEMILK